MFLKQHSDQTVMRPFCKYYFDFIHYNNYFVDFEFCLFHNLIQMSILFYFYLLPGWVVVLVGHVVVLVMGIVVVVKSFSVHL